jgi:hypothetical protein
MAKTRGGNKGNATKRPATPFPIKQPRTQQGRADEVIVESPDEGKDDKCNDVSEGVEKKDAVDDEVGMDSVVQVLQNIDDGSNPAGKNKDPGNIHGTVEFRLEKKYDSLQEERDAICK